MAVQTLASQDGFGSVELVSTERHFTPRVRKPALRPKDFQEVLTLTPCFLGSYFTKMLVSRIHIVDRSLYITEHSFHLSCILFHTHGQRGYKSCVL
jgi:hypothetical protein